MYLRPSERVQYRSRSTGAPVPAPGDRHGLPAAECPSGRPKDNASLIRTLFYYSPEEIAAIRDFERRTREWKLFIAESDNEDNESDEGADIRAAYAAAREDMRGGSEATQPLGERGGLDWSDEDEEEEVDLVGEAHARFRSWDENANKAADEERERVRAADSGANAPPEDPSIAITNDLAADPSDNATPQAQEFPFSATTNDGAAENAIDPSNNATPQAQEAPSSAMANNTAVGDAIHPNTEAPLNAQELTPGTIVCDFANGDTAPPQVPPTPRLEGIDHVPRAEKRRSQSPPERESSSGRMKLMETIAEGEEAGNGTESESETPMPSETELEGKEMEER